MNKLRPKKFDSYLGQKKVKENLQVVVKAAQQSTGPLDHILLCGSPGTGKTSLAHVIGAEYGHAIVAELLGSRITSISDLDGLLSIRPHDIIFIDEIHALPPKVEEALYEAMEDFKWNGQSIQPFTLIGATTKEGWLSKPMHARFTIIETLDLYSDAELLEILDRSALALEIGLSYEAAQAIAKRSRGTPRLANQYLKRVSNYAENGSISKDIAHKALKSIGIDVFGLDRVDREILQIMCDVFKSGPVGVQALATTMGEEPETIEVLREPYLLKIGFISRGPRGRSLTARGTTYLDKVVA